MYSVAYEGLSVYELGALTFRLLHIDYENGFFDDISSAEEASLITQQQAEAALVERLAQRISSADVPFCAAWASARMAKVSAKLLVNTANSWWSLKDNSNNNNTSSRQVQQHMTTHGAPSSLSSWSKQTSSFHVGRRGSTSRRVSFCGGDQAATPRSVTPAALDVASPVKRTSLTVTSPQQTAPRIPVPAPSSPKTTELKRRSRILSTVGGASSFFGASRDATFNESHENLIMQASVDDEDLVNTNETKATATSNNNEEMQQRQTPLQKHFSASKKATNDFSSRAATTPAAVATAAPAKNVSQVEILFRWFAACPELVAASTRRSLPRWWQPISGGAGDLFLKLSLTTASDGDNLNNVVNNNGKNMRKVPTSPASSSATQKKRSMILSGCTRLGGDALLQASFSVSITDSILTEKVTAAADDVLKSVPGIVSHNPLLPSAQGKQVRLTLFVRDRNSLEALVVAVDQPSPLPKVLMSKHPITISPRFWAPLDDPDKPFTVVGIDHRLVRFAEVRAMTDFAGFDACVKENSSKSGETTAPTNMIDSSSSSNKSSVHEHRKAILAQSKYSAAVDSNLYTARAFESHFIAFATSDSRVVVARVRPSQILTLCNHVDDSCADEGSDQNSKSSNNSKNSKGNNNSVINSSHHATDSLPFLATCCQAKVLSPWTCVKLFVCGPYLVVLGGTQLGDIEWMVVRDAGNSLHHFGTIRGHSGAVRTLTKTPPSFSQPWFWSCGVTDSCLALYSLTASYQQSSQPHQQQAPQQPQQNQQQQRQRRGGGPEVQEIRRLRFDPAIGAPMKLRYDSRTGYLLALWPGSCRVMLPSLPPDCDVVELRESDSTSSSSSNNNNNNNSGSRSGCSATTTTTTTTNCLNELDDNGTSYNSVIMSTREQRQTQHQTLFSPYNHLLADVCVDLGNSAPTAATVDVKGNLRIFDLRTFKLIQSLLPRHGSSPQHLSLSTFSSVLPFGPLALGIAADHSGGIFCAEEVIPVGQRPAFHSDRPCLFLNVLSVTSNRHDQLQNSHSHSHNHHHHNDNNSNNKRLSLQIPPTQHKSVGGAALSLTGAANVRSLAGRMLATLKRQATVCKTFIISSTEDEVQFFAVDSGRAVNPFKWKIPLIAKDRVSTRRRILVEKRVYAHASGDAFADASASFFERSIGASMSCSPHRFIGSATAASGFRSATFSASFGGGGVLGAGRGLHNIHTQKKKKQTIGDGDKKNAAGSGFLLDERIGTRAQDNTNAGNNSYNSYSGNPLLCSSLSPAAASEGRGGFSHQRNFQSSLTWLASPKTPASPQTPGAFAASSSLSPSPRQKTVQLVEEEIDLPSEYVFAILEDSLREGIFVVIAAPPPPRQYTDHKLRLEREKEEKELQLQQQRQKEREREREELEAQQRKKTPSRCTYTTNNKSNISLVPNQSQVFREGSNNSGSGINARRDTTAVFLDEHDARLSSRESAKTGERDESNNNDDEEDEEGCDDDADEEDEGDDDNLCSSRVKADPQNKIIFAAPDFSYLNSESPSRTATPTANEFSAGAAAAKTKTTSLAVEKEIIIELPEDSKYLGYEMVGACSCYLPPETTTATTQNGNKTTGSVPPSFALMKRNSEVASQLFIPSISPNLPSCASAANNNNNNNNNNVTEITTSPTTVSITTSKTVTASGVATCFTKSRESPIINFVVFEQTKTVITTTTTIHHAKELSQQQQHQQQQHHHHHHRHSSLSSTTTTTSSLEFSTTPLTCNIYLGSFRSRNVKKLLSGTKGGTSVVVVTDLGEIAVVDLHVALRGDETIAASYFTFRPSVEDSFLHRAPLVLLGNAPLMLCTTEAAVIDGGFELEQDTAKSASSSSSAAASAATTLNKENELENNSAEEENDDQSPNNDQNFPTTSLPSSPRAFSAQPSHSPLLRYNNKLIITRPVIVGIGEPKIVARTQTASGLCPIQLHFGEDNAVRRIVSLEVLPPAMTTSSHPSSSASHQHHSPSPPGRRNSTSATTVIAGNNDNNNINNVNNENSSEKDNDHQSSAPLAGSTFIAIYGWTPHVSGHELVPLSFFKPFDCAIGSFKFVSLWEAVIVARSDRPEVCVHAVPSGTYLGSLDAFTSVDTGATNSEWQVEVHRRKVAHDAKQRLHSTAATTTSSSSSSSSKNNANFASSTISNDEENATMASTTFMLMRHSSTGNLLNNNSSNNYNCTTSLTPKTKKSAVTMRTNNNNNSSNSNMYLASSSSASGSFSKAPMHIVDNAGGGGASGASCGVGASGGFKLLTPIGGRTVGGGIADQKQVFSCSNPITQKHQEEIDERKEKQKEKAQQERERKTNLLHRQQEEAKREYDSLTSGASLFAHQLSNARSGDKTVMFEDDRELTDIEATLEQVAATTALLAQRHSQNSVSEKKNQIMSSTARAILSQLSSTGNSNHTETASSSSSSRGKSGNPVYHLQHPVYLKNSSPEKLTASDPRPTTDPNYLLRVATAARYQAPPSQQQQQPDQQQEQQKRQSSNSDQGYDTNNHNNSKDNNNKPAKTLTPRQQLLVSVDRLKTIGPQQTPKLPDLGTSAVVNKENQLREAYTYFLRSVSNPNQPQSLDSSCFGGQPSPGFVDGIGRVVATSCPTVQLEYRKNQEQRGGGPRKLYYSSSSTPPSMTTSAPTLTTNTARTVAAAKGCCGGNTVVTLPVIPQTARRNN